MGKRARFSLAAVMFGTTFAMATGAFAGIFAPGNPTSLNQRIVAAPGTGFRTLTSGEGEQRTVRDATTAGEAFGTAGASRADKRRHLAYFAQTTDVHLTDEESPARVEFLDSGGGAFSSAWRPAEALGPFEAKAMVEKINQLDDGSPNLDGNGFARKMDFMVSSGDISDNQHYNEVLWNLRLLEGGTIDPGTGVDPSGSIGSNPLCPADLEIKDAADPGRYTGVQDIDDWPGVTPGYFYDPDDPAPFGPDTDKVNPYRTAPNWPGLMDRAQQSFTSPGVDVPTYVTTGNHDGLVQGNAWATGTFNRLATGCLKPLNDDEDNSGFSNQPLFDLVVNPNLTVQDMVELYRENPELFIGVPPDPGRRLISKKTFKNIFQSGSDPRGHGFDLVEKAELRASDGTAGYYSFSPRRGLRMVVLDTVSEGGRIFASSSGNIDAPQFAWFERQLQSATRSNELVVVISHHPISSLTADVADEEAPSCSDVDIKVDVGCDSDPRDSMPVKLSSDAVALMHRYPHAVAWIGGHTHENRIRSYPAPGNGSGFWSIETSSIADWPKQGRLVDLFDNRDGTLSIMTTIIDHGAPVETPAPGTPASGMSGDELAAISRTLSYNDTQGGGGGEGNPGDRNSELLVKDPRRNDPTLYPFRTGNSRVKVKAGRKAVAVTIRVVNEGRSATPKTSLRVKAKGKGLKIGAPKTVRALGVGQATSIKVRIRAVRKTRGNRSVTVSVAGRSVSIPVTVRR